MGLALNEMVNSDGIFNQQGSILYMAIKIVIEMAQYGPFFMSYYPMKMSQWLTENFSFEKEYGWLLVGGEWRYRCRKYMFKYCVQ